MDYQNIREVLLFLCRLTDAIVHASADGNFNILKDWAHFIPAAKAIVPAITDFKEIPKEYEDLDDNERDELHAFVVAEFDLMDEDVEVFIEKAFKVALDLAELVEYGMEVFGEESG